MKTKSGIKVIWIAITACAVLAACSSALSGASSTQTALAELPTAAPTQTVKPSATPLPTHTPTSTPLPTQTPTVTPTSTSAAQAEFAGAELLATGYLPNWRYLLIFKLPQAVQGNYYMMMDQNKEYQCDKSIQFPDRLYCSGPQTAVDDWVAYQVFEKETDLLVFEGQIFIPLTIR